MTHKVQKINPMLLLCNRIGLCLFAFLAVNSVFANPMDGTVAAGSATITQTPNTTVIDQASQRAVIDWRSFNIGANESTHFNQPNGGVTLNRIDPTQGMSQIYGRLTATGQIILVNPAGIYFGPGAYVNVGGIIASSVGVSLQNFMAGNFIFDQHNNMNGAVINAGTIHAGQNGLIAMLGANVSNEGLMEVQTGSVVLASGKAFTVDMQGNQLVNFAVNADAAGVAHDAQGNVMQDGVKNSGAIMAHGGRVIIAAKTASAILDHAINMSGVIEVKSVAQKNGEIILSGHSGTVLVSGKLIASGKSAGEKGGVVKVLGDKIAVYDHAVIDVSGDLGGGTALLGGNAEGIGPLQNASYLFFGSDAKIYADAISQGDGGVVVLWSDLGTKFYGTISARGGVNGGNGGWVETSGKEYLEAYGSVNASAANGNAGSWLLDPRNVTIQNAATSGGSFNGASPNVFTPNADNAVVDRNTIEASLNGGTSVTITTGTTGTQAGNITVQDTITKTAGGAATLTLTATAATGVVSLLAAISSTVGALTVTMSGLRIDVGANITTNGGNINFNSPTALTAGVTLNTGAGNTTFASTLNGAQALAINSTGTTTFTGIVGGTTPISSIITDAGGSTAINGGAFTTSGAAGQVYNDAVTVNANTTFTANNSGAITFNSTLDSFSTTSRNVAFNTAGVTTFNGAVGVTRTLSTFTTDAAGSTVMNGGTISTASTQTYNDAVTLGADTTLNATNSNVVFASTLDRDVSASALTINAGSGAITLTGNVGAGVNGALGALALNSTGVTSITGALAGASLTTNAGGSTTLNTSTITTSGNIVFNDAVTLASAATKTLTSTGGLINFVSTVTGNFGLIVSAATTALFGSTVGTAALTSLNVSAASGININGSVTTSGTQTYQNAVTLGASSTFTTTNSNIIFNSTIDRDATARAPTFSAGSGDILFAGNMGAGVNGALGAVVINNTGTTTINGVLNAASVNTNAGGTTILNGGSVTATATAGIVFNDAVILGADTNISTIGNRLVTFASTVDRDGTARALTVNSGTANTTLTGNVGTGVNGALGAITLNNTGVNVISGTVNAASLTTNAGGGTTLNTSSITTSGDMVFNDAITLVSAATKTLTSTAGLINFASTIIGGFNLIVAAATSVRFGSTVGTTGLSGLDVSAPSGININASITTTGAQAYHNAVTLGANAVLTTTNNAITFDSTIDRDATARTLTLTTGTGGITLAGNIGAGVNGALGALTLNSTGTGVSATNINGTVNAASIATNAGGTTHINNGSITTSGTQTFADAVVLNADTTLTTTNSAVSFTAASTLDRDTTARNLTINAGTSTIGLSGNVGSGVNGALGDINLNATGITTITGTINAGSLTTNTTGGTTLNTSSITTSGNMVFNDAVTLASVATKTLTSTAGLINFVSTVSGAFALVASAANTITFGSTVGITALTSLDVTAPSGIFINGTVTTTGTQAYHSPVTLDVNGVFTSTNSAIAFDSTVDRDATLRALTISSGTGAITLGGNVGEGVNGALGATILNSTGATTIGGTLSAATLTTNAGGTTAINGGAITTGGTQTYSDAVTLGQNTVFTVTAALSDILMANLTNNIDKTITFATAGAGTYRDISLSNSNAAAVVPTLPTGLRNLTLNFTNAGMNFHTLTLIGALTATANGAITQSGALAVTGTATFASGAANNTTLDNAGNNFSTIVVTNGNNVSVRDSNAVILGAFNVSNNLNVTTGGAITQSGAIVVAGATSIDAGGNGVSLTTTTNNFNSVGVTNANNVSLRDVNSIILDASTIGGTFGVTANGTITQNGALSVVGVTTLVAGAANNITLNNIANNFSTVAVTSGNNVALTDINALILGASTISGTYNVTTDGAITQSGALIVTGATSLNAGGNAITLTTATNNFSSVGVTNASNVLLRDTNAIILDASTIGGTFGVTANGAITQSGAVVVSGVTTLAAGAANDITLNNATNNFSTVVTTNGNNLTLTDMNALILGASTISGDLSVTTGGAFTQSAALTVAGVSTFAAGSNNITLNNAGNNFNSVGITNANNVLLTDTNSLILNASTIAGTLGVTTNGALTQSGSLAIAGVTTLAAGALNDITLNDSANNFSTVAITNARNVSLTDVNAIDVGASTVSGNMTINAGGIISDSGNLIVNGGNGLTVSAVGGLILDANNQIARVNVSNATSGNILLNSAVGFTVAGFSQTGTGATLTSAGAVTLLDGVTINTNNGALAISAADLNLNATGALNSGTATTTITQTTVAGSIGLGDTAGTMSISGDELQRINTADLALIAANNGLIVVNNITAANSANVANLTLNATTGTLGAINFVNNASTFNTLTATADNGITVGTALSALVGDINLDSANNLMLNANLASVGGLMLSAINGIVLGAPVALTGNGILINNAIDGAFNLTLDSGANTTTFNSTVGAATPIGGGVGAAITINSAGAIVFNNRVATNAGMIATGPITFNKVVTMGNGNTGSIFSGLVTLNDSVGFTFSGFNGLNFNGGLATNGGTMTINSNASTMNLAAVNMNSDLTVKSQSASINFNSSVNGPAHTLTLQDNTAASTGTVTFAQYPNVGDLVIFGPPADYLVIFPTNPIPPIPVPTDTSVSDINNVLGIMYDTNAPSPVTAETSSSVTNLTDASIGGNEVSGFSLNEVLGSGNVAVPNAVMLAEVALKAMTNNANQTLTVAQALINDAIRLGVINLIADGSKMMPPPGRVPHNTGTENAILNPANLPLTQQDKQSREPNMDPLSLKFGNNGKLLNMGHTIKIKLH